MRPEVDRRDFERLNAIEKSVNNVQFDHRSIREDAQREATQAPTSNTSAKKVSKPFQRLVAVQTEKYRRDKYWFDRLSKEKKSEQLRNDRLEGSINKAMQPKKTTIPAAKQHRAKKSVSTAFFSLMRPISSAFVSESHTTGAKRSPQDLDFDTSGKPSLVLSLADSRATQFINNDRAFTFLLKTEDGGHYLLQAMSKGDMSKWIEAITQVSQLAAKRRLTYLGNSPKPQVSDHIHQNLLKISPGPTAGKPCCQLSCLSLMCTVFGVDLMTLLRRETGSHDVPPGTVPAVIERCLSEIEKRGLTEVGICELLCTYVSPF